METVNITAAEKPPRVYKERREKEMRRTKKMLALLLAGVLTFSNVAYAATGDDGPTPKVNAAETDISNPEEEAEAPEPEHWREVERVFLLRAIDARWMAHIDDMDQLRQGIGLQAYGHRDPKVEYKMVGYDMFGEMTKGITEDTIGMLFHVRIERKVEREQVAKVTGTNKDDSAVKEPKKRTEKKVYPNDPCPCGSGKKYKQCCGRKK